MWKVFFFIGLQFCAFRALAAPQALDWRAINQTLWEISRDVSTSFDFLRDIDLQFDEAGSNLGNEKMSLKIGAEVNQAPWSTGPARLNVELSAKGAGQVVDGRRAFESSLKVELDSESLPALRYLMRSQVLSCAGLSTRENSYAKIRQEILCRHWVQLESARSVEEVSKSFQSLREAARQRLTEYVKTATGGDLQGAQADLVALEKIKIAQQDGLFTLSGAFNWSTIEKLGVQAQMTLSNKKLSFSFSFRSQVEEAKYQKTKGDLSGWLLKLQDKDADLLAGLRLVVYAYGQGLVQQMASSQQQ